MASGEVHHHSRSPSGWLPCLQCQVTKTWFHIIAHHCFSCLFRPLMPYKEPLEWNLLPRCTFCWVKHRWKLRSGRMRLPALKKLWRLWYVMSIISCIYNLYFIYNNGNLNRFYLQTSKAYQNHIQNLWYCILVSMYQSLAWKLRNYGYILSSIFVFYQAFHIYP